VTVVAPYYSLKYFERLGSEAFRESFQNSLEIARQYSDRLHEDADQAVASWAASWEERAGAGPIDRDMAHLAEVTPGGAAHFAALYVRADTVWTLTASGGGEVARIDSTLAPAAIGRRGEFGVPAPEDGASGETDRGEGDRGEIGRGHNVEFGDDDLVASAILIAPESLLVAGLALAPGTMEKMRGTGVDLSRSTSLSEYVSNIRLQVIFLFAAMIIVAALASAVAARLIAGRISQPIRELAFATERIAAGDLSHRVDVEARDEIALLVGSFNEMTRELEENKQHLIRAERIAAWRDVARRIAHEIKNPLTPIEIAIYRLKKRLGEEAGDREFIEECLDSMLKEVKTLKTIAQDFSSFAKMPEPRLQPVDIVDALESVAGIYSPQFEQVEFVTDFRSGLPAVKADPVQIRSVLGNLIKNACEAMPEGGRLTLRALRRGENTVRLETADTGPGIPDEVADRIFHPYFTTKESGTGIGLALAYRIVEDHGGRIGFETGPEGTVFVVDLPSWAEEDSE
jgi:nitrogen fixation/metabolism regulation signal transduction histidine kinase